MRGQKYLRTAKKGPIRSKIKEEIGTNALGQIISGIKCDRDKPIFLQKEGVNKIELGMKKGPNGIRECQKRGSIEWKFPTMFKYGSAPPWGGSANLFQFGGVAVTYFNLGRRNSCQFIVKWSEMAQFCFQKIAIYQVCATSFGPGILELGMEKSWKSP